MRWWILAALPLAACGSIYDSGDSKAAAASGARTARSFDLADFTKVELRGSDDVDVAIGPRFAVTADGNPKLLDELEIVKEGETLRIGRKAHLGWNLGDRGEARIHVTLPRLTGANISGSGTMKIAHAQGDFSGAISGSGDLDLAALQGGSVHLATSGSGTIVAAGTADAIDVAITGSGDVDSRKLKASRGNVAIMGSGSLRATIAGPVGVSLVGSGDVAIDGGAKCTVSRLGSGDAHCS